MPDASNRAWRSNVHATAADAPTAGQVEKAFSALCRAMGKRVAGSTSEVGAWRLERRCTTEYRIAEIGTTARLVPPGQDWWTAGEFCKAAFFALRLLEISEETERRQGIER